MNVSGLLAKRARGLVYSARYLVNAYPAIYMPIARLRHGHRDNWALSRDTDLVIEGLARSGNTFVVCAFQIAQRRSVRVAHHTHAAAQVITAARMGVPALVIVRDPAQVAASHMALRGVSAKRALSAWVRYHERILPYRDRLEIADFDAVIRDVGEAIRRVNEKFGTRFDEFEHTAENEARVFQMIENLNRARFDPGSEEAARILARPSADREAKKQRFARGLDDPRLAQLRARADAVYRTLVPSNSGF